MFDSNIKGLPLNTIFFAEVSRCSKGSKLHNLGVRMYDVIACKMVSSKECFGLFTAVKVETTNGVVLVTDPDDSYWLVFAGYRDGTGFIDEVSREKSKDVIRKALNLQLEGEIWKV